MLFFINFSRTYKLHFQLPLLFPVFHDCTIPALISEFLPLISKSNSWRLTHLDGNCRHILQTDSYLLPGTSGNPCGCDRTPRFNTKLEHVTTIAMSHVVTFSVWKLEECRVSANGSIRASKQTKENIFWQSAEIRSHWEKDRGGRSYPFVLY